MNNQLIELKSQIKQELIVYYEILRSNVDINFIKNEKLIEMNQSKQKAKLFEVNSYLVKQINRVFDSNLNDINNYFQDLDQNKDASTLLTFGNGENVFRNVKEDIKKKALKSYLICLEIESYSKFGLHLEFKWYIDQNQMDFIKIETRSIQKDKISCIIFSKIFKLPNHKSKNSFHQLPDPSNLIKFIRKFHTKGDNELNCECILENDAFSLMNQLKHLDLSFFKFSKYKIKNGSFEGLSNNLEHLVIGECELNENDVNIFSNLTNLKYLELNTQHKHNPNIFSCLTNLVNLNFNCDTDYLMPCYEISFDSLENLQILRIQLQTIRKNHFKSLKSLKEMYLSYNKLIKIENGGFLGLENLVKLDLSYNNLFILESGIFNGLCNLKELDLTRSNFKNIHQDAFKGLHNLENLNLSYIWIFNLFDQVFHDLINLKTLNLEYFYFDEIVSTNPFKYFSKLTSLRVDIILYKEKISAMLQECHFFNNIEHICIIDNDTNKAFDQIDNKSLLPKKLFNLEIKYPEYQGDINYSRSTILIHDKTFVQLDFLKMLTISKLPCLKNIKIETNAFKNLINLEYLDLSYDEIDFTNEHNHLINNLINLTHLNLSHNENFDVDSNFFFGLDNLKHLDLSNTEVSLKDNLFEPLINLETLDLSQTSLYNIGLNELSFNGLSNLKQLTLNSNDSIFGAINKLETLNSKIFNQLKNLINLDLSINGIKQIDLDSFNGLKKIEVLNLSYNKIDQRLCQQHFKDLVNLKQLELFENPFIYKIDYLQFYQDINIKELDLIVI